MSGVEVTWRVPEPVDGSGPRTETIETKRGVLVVRDDDGSYRVLTLVEGDKGEPPEVAGADFTCVFLAAIAEVFGPEAAGRGILAFARGGAETVERRGALLGIEKKEES